MQIPDQKPIWDAKHAADEHAEYRWEPSPFGRQVENGLLPHSRVLDLGCGVGGDALYFAKQGHTVVAADLSAVVLEQNNELFTEPDLHLVQTDMAKGLPFSDNAFDAAFAHLSLHYFDSETSRSNFVEIARILRQGGLLGFACKSINDPDNGKGTKVEPDVYISSGGHVRHFFSHATISRFTEGFFLVEHVDEVTETYSQKTTSFIRCIARRAIAPS